MSVGQAQPVTSGSQVIEAFDVSADGRWLAFDSDRGGNQQIYRMPLAGGEPEQLTSGSEPAFYPSISQPQTLQKRGFVGTWSPDGRSVLIAMGLPGEPGGLEAVPASGGTGRMLVQVRDPATDVLPLRYAWSSDGRFVYFLGDDAKDRTTAIWSVPATGGTPRPLVRFDDPSRPWHRIGFRVHGGRFYFTIGDQQSDVWMAELSVAR